MLIVAAANAGIPILIKLTVKFLSCARAPKCSGRLRSPCVARDERARRRPGSDRRVLIDSVGERIVARAQRDMFDSLIARDLASLNAVHSAQFVSNFLYDVTLMRDADRPGRLCRRASGRAARRLRDRDVLSGLAAGAHLACWRCPPSPGPWSGSAARCAAPPPAAWSRPAISPRRCPKRWTDGASSRPMDWRASRRNAWMRALRCG